MEKRGNKKCFVLISDLVLLICLLFTINTHAETIQQLDGTEITLYGQTNTVAGYIGPIPESYPTSYQINAPAGSTFSITSGSSATVDSNGLISVVSGKNSGDTVIKVSSGDDNAYITVHVTNYAVTYADNILSEYISQNITGNMTTYEKLEKIAQFIAYNYDYSTGATSYVSMIVTGGGDCWASTSTVIKMCQMIGLDAWARNGNHDSGAGSGHMNAIAYDDGIYYIVEAGFSSKKPRGYEIITRETPFSYFRIGGQTGIYIYQYDGKDDTGTLVVPATINGEAVVGLDDQCFSRNDFSEIVLPDTLKTIGDFVAADCDNLTKFNIPAGVESIGIGFLNDTDKMENLTIDPANSYFTVSDGMLFTKDMTQIIAAPTVNDPVIPEIVTTIAPYSFRGNSHLTTIELPASVTEVGEGAFGDCNLLTTFNAIGSSLETIGDFAFNSIFRLSNILLPETLVSIGDAAFRDCYSIQNVWYAGTQEQWDHVSIGVYNEKLTSCPNIIFQSEGPKVNWSLSNGTLTISGTGVMEGYAYAADTPWADQNDTITAVVVEEGITGVGSHAFSELKNLKTVSLPDTLESIGNYAFAGSTSLEMIELPESVDILGAYAFDGCWGLKAITMPQHMDSIGECAFYDCRRLKSITIPEGIMTIDPATFSNCRSLITFDASASSLETIGNYTFYYDYNLMNIMLPETLETVGDYAFIYCSSIQKVWFGGTAEQWNQISFGTENEYLTGCTNIIYQSQGPQLIRAARLPMYVGQSVMIPTVGSATVTSDYTYVASVSGKKITAEMDGTTTIHVRSGDDVYMDYFVTVYSDPVVLHLPATVTMIEEEAFEGDSNIQFVELGSAVQEVEADAFAGSGVIQITVPSKTTVFDAGAFGGSMPLIVCAEGSVAETFAEQNGYTYVYMH